MKFVTYVSVALVASLLAFTCVQSLSIPETGQHAGHEVQASAGNGGPNVTVKESDKAQSKARYLGGVGGYETPIIPYEAPIQQPYIQQQSYVPQVQSYGSSYQQPIQSYGSSYQQPIVQQPYVQQSYQQPIVQSSYSQQSSYVAPVTPAYQQPIVQQSYGQSYQQPIIQQSYGGVQQGYGGIGGGLGGLGVGSSVGFGGVSSFAGGQVLKRSLGSQHETGAPYQMLVDHLAAAASEVFTNVSTIECPPKPTSYTCPQMLNLTKEELKKKLCDYESALTGVMSLVPDTEKSTTRCGAFKINKQDTRSDEALVDLPEKMAVIVGKDCNLKSVMDGSINKDQVYVLAKKAVPAGTKLIIADGTNIDLLNSQAVSKEELSALLKQCPKKSSQ